MTMFYIRPVTIEHPSFSLSFYEIFDNNKNFFGFAFTSWYEEEYYLRDITKYENARTFFIDDITIIPRLDSDNMIYLPKDASFIILEDSTILKNDWITLRVNKYCDTCGEKGYTQATPIISGNNKDIYVLVSSEGCSCDNLHSFFLSSQEDDKLYKNMLEKSNIIENKEKLLQKISTLQSVTVQLP